MSRSQALMDFIAHFNSLTNYVPVLIDSSSSCLTDFEPSRFE